MFIFTVLIADTTQVKRTNITGCYDEATNLKLNLNTYTLTLGLNPKNKTECHAIEQSVIVNLTLHANGYICDNITLVLLNFSYINTTSIEFNFYKDTLNVFNIGDVFCNASLGQDEYLQAMPELTFAFIQIYTHSHIMTTEVMEYSQVKTNISGCFSKIHAQMTDHYQINLTIGPTLVCKNLINEKPTSGTADNYISVMEVTFGDVSFTLNDTEMKKLINAYDDLKEESVLITGEEKIKQIAESDGNTGQLKLTTVQNGVSVQILYTLNFSQTSVRPFFTYGIFTGGEDMMFFQFNANRSVAENITNDPSKPFTSYKYKLIITQGNDYITYQKVHQTSKYDPDDSIWIIQCDTMTEFQKEKCQNYSEFMRTSKDVDVQLYVGFYDEDDNFLFHEQVKLTQELACIKELEVRYVNNQYVRAHSIIDEQEICKPYLKYKVQNVHLLVAAEDYHGEYEELYLVNDSTSAIADGEFHCVPGKKCAITKEYIALAQKNTVFYGVELLCPEGEHVKFAVATNKLAIENDNIISYSSIGIGASTVVACTCMTLYGMVTTMKRVKLIKKKKLKL